MALFSKVKIKKIIIIIVLLFIIVPIIIDIIRLNTKTIIIVDEFEVPEYIRQTKFTGKSISYKLIDNIYSILKEYPLKKNDDLEFRIDYPKIDHSIEFTYSKFSIKIPIQYFVDKFIKPFPRVNGEIVSYKDLLKFTIRVIGKPPKTVTEKEENIDLVMQVFAQYILKYLKPISLVYYQYYNDKIDELKETLKYCIYNEPFDDDAIAYNIWGIILLDDGQYQMASDKFEKAVEIDPKNVNAYNNWSGALFHLGKYDKTLEKFKKVIEIDKFNTTVYYNWGNLLAKKGDDKGAIAKYRKVIEIDSNDVYTYFNWGNSLRKIGDDTAAAEKYKKAIQIDPEDWKALDNLGVILTKWKKYDKAISKYKESIKINPSNDVAYYNWGNALREMEDYKGAIKKYKKVIEIAPKFSNAYLNWGISLKELGDLDGAINKFKKAIYADSSNIFAYIHWGEILGRIKNYQGAIEKLKIVVTINPDFSMTYFLLGVTYYIKRDIKNSFLYFNKYLEIDPDGEKANDAKKFINELNRIRNKNQQLSP